MTICIALKGVHEIDGEEMPAVVFATDTQETSGFLKTAATKCKTIFGKVSEKFEEPWSILLAASGDALVIDEVTDEIDYFLRDEIEADEDCPSAVLSILRSEIGDIAYNTYKKYKDRNVSDPMFELLLGTSDRFSTILYVTFEGKSQEFKSFKIIGTGRITGGELLLSEFYRENLDPEEAALLACFVITQVGHIDRFVGGEPDINACWNRTLWKFTEFGYSDVMEQTYLRWDLLKKLWWKMDEDDEIVKRIEEILESE